MLDINFKRRQSLQSAKDTMRESLDLEARVLTEKTRRPHLDGLTTKARIRSLNNAPTSSLPPYSLQLRDANPLLFPQSLHISRMNKPIVKLTSIEHAPRQLLLDQPKHPRLCQARFFLCYFVSYLEDFERVLNFGFRVGGRRWGSGVDYSKQEEFLRSEAMSFQGCFADDGGRG